MTPFTKKKEIKNNWYIINAQNAPVGRLAAYISKVLRGKVFKGPSIIKKRNTFRNEQCIST